MINKTLYRKWFLFLVYFVFLRPTGIRSRGFCQSSGNNSFGGCSYSGIAVYRCSFLYKKDV